MTPILFLTATQLAAGIRNGDFTATEVVRAHLAHIAAHADLRAVVTVDAQGALARAAEADAARARGELWGPLHGVPVTFKDSFATRGLRTTAGHPPLAHNIPREDAVVVAQVRDAGAIVLGKTNLAQLAMDMQTTNPVFGMTPNAWDRTRTSGGSSGGCATALAMGLTPLSFGSDLAGSLRVPSAWSGVYAFKPTWDVVSLRGHLPPLPGEVSGIPHGLAVAGPLARSVEDLELGFRVIVGPSHWDPTVRPVRPLVDPPAHLSDLRISISTELGGVPVDHRVTDAMRVFADRLRKAGATVTEAAPADLSYEETWDTWGALVGMQGGYNRNNLTRWLGDRFAGRSVAHIPHQRRILEPISVPRYMAALDAQRRSIASLERFLDGYDAWIVPPSATVAPPHQTPTRTFGIYNVYDEPLPVDGRHLPYYVATQAYTTLFSVTESPVVSMPIGQTPDGLPVGVQVVGQRSEDLRLLHVAALLDDVTPQLPRPPGLPTGPTETLPTLR